MNPFSNGLSAVQKDGKWGFIDKQGNTIIDFKYNSCSNFSEGLAQVNINNKIGYINENGKVIIGNIE